MPTKLFSLHIKVLSVIWNIIFQFPIGLFDCNETKTADVIELLSDLQRKYVPQRNQEIVEPLFFGGEIFFL